jgi:hypothetical protein
MFDPRGRADATIAGHRTGHGLRIQPHASQRQLVLFEASPGVAKPATSSFPPAGMNVAAERSREILSEHRGDRSQRRL